MFKLLNSEFLFEITKSYKKIVVKKFFHFINCENVCSTNIIFF